MLFPDHNFDASGGADADADADASVSVVQRALASDAGVARERDGVAVLTSVPLEARTSAAEVRNLAAEVRTSAAEGLPGGTPAPAIVDRARLMGTATGSVAGSAAMESKTEGADGGGGGDRLVDGFVNGSGFVSGSEERLAQRVRVLVAAELAACASGITQSVAERCEARCEATDARIRSLLAAVTKLEAAVGRADARSNMHVRRRRSTGTSSSSSLPSEMEREQTAEALGEPPQADAHANATQTAQHDRQTQHRTHSPHSRHRLANPMANPPISDRTDVAASFVRRQSLSAHPKTLASPAAHRHTGSRHRAHRVSQDREHPGRERSQMLVIAPTSSSHPPNGAEEDPLRYARSQTQGPSQGGMGWMDA